METPFELFFAKLQESLDRGTFVRLRLTPLRAKMEGADRDSRAEARLVQLKGQNQLSVTVQQGSQTETRNHPVGEGLAWIRENLGNPFGNAWLGTTAKDWQLTVQDGGAARLVGHKPAQTTVPSRVHDERRETILDDTAGDWLKALGILNAEGRVLPGKTDKFHQVNRYLEILTHLVRECGWLEPPAAPSLTLADMGCGKAYLTFGAWHLFRRVFKLPVRVIGVEQREALAAAGNRTAQAIAAEGLEFATGAIQEAPLPPLDALVALHACNTATDDAIRRGIALGARLIVVAPCCHQEARPQMQRPEPLAPILRHGIMEERLAEWLTDGLRSLYLEWAGYRTKVFEFIDTGHTPKNLMISAIRCREPFQAEEAREAILKLKQFFGIVHHALDPLLGG